jgi:hypothetical protein
VDQGKYEQTNAQRNGTSLRMAYNLLQMKKKYVERSGLESSGSREVSGCLIGTQKCNTFLNKWATIISLSSSITLLYKLSQIFMHGATFPVFYTSLRLFTTIEFCDDIHYVIFSFTLLLRLLQVQILSSAHVLMFLQCTFCRSCMRYTFILI